MLTESRFDFERPMAGLEIELNLVDDGLPAGHAQRRGAGGDRGSFVPDRARPLQHRGQRRSAPAGRVEASADFEQSVRKSLNDADPRAQPGRRQLVMIGILPTLMPHHVTLDSVSENPRYSMLDQQIFAARGEDLEIVIDGVERLAMVSDTIMPEAACTSTQVHLQVSPDDFAGYWNAAQAIAGVQVALGANSPFLFGKQLVAESRIPLFEQSTDTRAEELKPQGVRPRVWFGERWITSIFDLFEENSRYFPALLPISSDEDPVAVLDAGGVPRAGRAAAAQRHRLPLEPTGVRRQRRHAAPAGGEPGAARRADRRGHHGERRLLRRAGPCVGRSRTARSGPQMSFQAAQENFVVRHPGRHRRRGLLAAGRSGARRQSWWYASCCRWLPKACVNGRWTRLRSGGCSTSSSAAACGRPTARPGKSRRWRRSEASGRVQAGMRCSGMLASVRDLMHTQRTSPHLGGELSVADRAGRQRCVAARRRPSSVIVVGYSSKPEGRAALRRASSEARSARRGAGGRATRRLKWSSRAQAES